MDWKIEISDTENEYRVTAPGKMGRGCESSNAIEIRGHHHYNGSGPQAFGGAKQWPNVTLQVAFEEGQEELRDTFIKSLRAHIENFFEG